MESSQSVGGQGGRLHGSISVVKLDFMVTVCVNVPLQYGKTPPILVLADKAVFKTGRN